MILSLGSKMVQFAEALTSHVTPSKPKTKNLPSTVPALKEDDEPYVFKQTVSIEDDGISKLDLNLRHFLWIPNLDPEAWWKEPFSSRVSRPIRGATLYLESCLGPSKRVNEVWMNFLLSSFSIF